MHPPFSRADSIDVGVNCNFLAAVSAASVMTASAAMASAASTAVTATARLDFPLRHRLSQKPVLRHPENRLPARHISGSRGGLFTLF